MGESLEALGIVLQAHLTLEALLIEMCEIVKSEEQAVPLSFPGKTKFLAETQKLPFYLQEAFDHFNNFRNDVAHIFSFKLDLATALELARTLEDTGIDFSDSVGHLSQSDATKYYGGLEGVLAEIGWCVLFEASNNLVELGGRDIFSA